MTKKETNTIRGKMAILTFFLESARAERDKAIDEGNWNDANYWKGRIEQTIRTLDFLHELTNWEFFKNEKIQ